MQSNRRTVLLAEKNIRSDVFCHFLSSNTGLNINHVSTDNDWQQALSDWPGQLNGDDLLLFIDLISRSQISLERIFDDAERRFRHWDVVLLNAPRNVDKELILQWPNCCGILHSEVSKVELMKGVKKIIAGEYWLPRMIMSELLEYYREGCGRQNKRNCLITASLTSREEDILKLLATGISNAEMAETLFISESTIKSHLYKMFKKIDVKNRIQARSWARENLNPDRLA
ncbi:LuxR C-terminal-related transcriptional regulator [Photobacterium sp. SDRW27]|uniref:LuxR C-terminal-related transcriptional regulator n=1 Tax=Photobacterium obscurum TaxID=2829490 RepID=UPI002243B7DC|nr:LuxR C-terminal-related transcriptional regulator [Photobacterium obscurum]MCW8327213.1 LuxR C-terminal-related transcriptional regulator [Photobacterium obscurum]